MYFKNLIQSFSEIASKNVSRKLTTLRQLNICLGILYSWGRKENNVESAFLSSELCILHAWNIAKTYFGDQRKLSEKIVMTFFSIFGLYTQIATDYLENKILPHTGKRHALSYAVESAHYIDVNLKLFDILGRLAIQGLWIYWNMQNNPALEEKQKQDLKVKIKSISNGLKNFIMNNPALCSPCKDDQAIDISLALLFLALNSDNYIDIRIWLNETVNRTLINFKGYGYYPCIFDSYLDLMEYSNIKDPQYREEVTNASTLYPLMAIWAVLLDDSNLYEKIKVAKQHDLKHCDFQLWYPDESSEETFYINCRCHGRTLLNINLVESKDEFINAILEECKHSSIQQLSVFQQNFWPIILIACRHHRYPLPIDLVGFLIPDLLKNIKFISDT